MRFALHITFCISAGFAFAADPLRESLTTGITFLEGRLKRDPDDFVAANQLAERLARRAAWTGSLEDLRRAEAVATQSLGAAPAEENKAGAAVACRLAFSMHRFAEAKTLAERLMVLEPAKSTGLILKGDACLELGELASAEAAFDEALKMDGPTLALEWRRARLLSLRGNHAEATEHTEGALNLARELPESAVDTLVWSLVQSGESAFKRGDWELAEKRYEEARKFAPNQWRVLDHIAELRAAQGKDADAVELFTAATKAADRPEVWQALGDCHAFFKRAAEAKLAHDRALAGYMASVEKGELLYIHHLAGFYSDSQENAAEAVKWARKDLEHRETGAAHDALAWALYKAREIPAAMEESKRALGTGIADAHVLYHAAMIHISASEVVEGQRLLRKCAEVNPHFNSFHIHR